MLIPYPKCLLFSKIPLGVLEKNEAKTENMIDIIETYQLYCPAVRGVKLPIGVGGDELTANVVKKPNLHGTMVHQKMPDLMVWW